MLSCPRFSLFLFDRYKISQDYHWHLEILNTSSIDTIDLWYYVNLPLLQSPCCHFLQPTDFLIGTRSVPKETQKVSFLDLFPYFLNTSHAFFGSNLPVFKLRSGTFCDEVKNYLKGGDVTTPSLHRLSNIVL